MKKPREQRIVERLVEEQLGAKQEHTWWLSFCDTEKPKGSQFMGVVITKSIGLAHAILKTWKLGVNPGGEIQSYMIDGSEVEIPETLFDRCVMKDELKANGLI